MKTRFYPMIAVGALFLAVAALSVALWTSVRAQEGAPEAVMAIPTTLNYQGYLRDPDGSLTNGAYKVTARIYNLAAGGSPLYTTSLDNVNVRDGLFNIVLGDSPALPAAVFANAPLYIGISLNSEAELIPRQRLHAVPWAFQASTLINNAPAQTIQGLTSNGNVTVNGATILNGAASVAGNATVGGDTTLNGAVSVAGNATVGGDTTLNGTLLVAGNVARSGETSIGPHFLNQKFEVRSWASCPASSSWTPVNLPDTVPQGATAVIFEYRAQEHLSLASDIVFRQKAGAPELRITWGRAASDGDDNGWGGQGIFPYDDSTRSLEYTVRGGGYAACEIQIIGYFK